MSKEQQGFWSQHNKHPIPLKGMQVKAVLQDLLSEVTISQIFTNDEQQPIEAVYTFPLPMDALLLSFSVLLGERQLLGVVQERKQAEAAYEDAISEGNTAILLQQLEAGLYTVNVGNLLAHETAIITFSYAQLHQWSNDELRWHLPTVIAPRYGKPALQAQQIPESDISVEHLYTLEVSVRGLLRTALIQSPSHSIETEIANFETRINLKEGRAFLDRDLILTLQLAANKVCAVSDRDFEGYVALASFYPELDAATQNQQPRSIKLLVDCSGSMAGDSITQARIALMNIVDSLAVQDTFSLIRFGDSVVREITKPLAATKANIIKARNIIAKIEADLGGTEIFKALKETINLKSEQPSADILLITDGEVWDESSENSQTQKIIQLAKQSQQRIFTVGVGSAVSEKLVRELAEGTQGACELVTPGEGMASKIERHFKRIYAEQALGIEVSWPSEPLWQTTPTHLFMGDTLHVLATFPDKPTGRVTLTAEFGNGAQLQQASEIVNIGTDEGVSTLARFSANHKLKHIPNQEEEVALAVKYQLMCKATAYLVVDVNPELMQGNGMPDLRKVPKMLAAGWGGTGSVMANAVDFDYLDIPAFLRKTKSDEIDNYIDYDDFILDLDDPSQEQSQAIVELHQYATPKQFVKNSRQLFKHDFLTKKLIVTDLWQLLDVNLPDDIFKKLQEILNAHNNVISEQQLIVGFFKILLDSPVRPYFDEKEQEAINNACNSVISDLDTIMKILKIFYNVDENSWGVDTI